MRSIEVSFSALLVVRISVGGILARIRGVDGVGKIRYETLEEVYGCPGEDDSVIGWCNEGGHHWRNPNTPEGCHLWSFW